MISKARAKLASQQVLMFNYIDLQGILISISNYLAAPKPLSCSPTPSRKCTRATTESLILKEKISMLSVEKTNTNSGLLGQGLAYPFFFHHRGKGLEGIWQNQEGPTSSPSLTVLPKK